MVNTSKEEKHANTRQKMPRDFATHETSQFLRQLFNRP